MKEINITTSFKQFDSITELPKEIQDLRTFYEIPNDASDASPGRNATSYQLIRVGYSSSDEYLFVRASKCESHRHFGNEWRVLNESDEGMSGHRSLT